MNKFYLKKLFDFVHKEMARFRVANTPELNWHIILIIFIILNLISTAFAYSFFRKVSSLDSAGGVKSALSIESVTFSRKALRDALDIYKNREVKLEHLKISPPASSDPSL